MYDLAVIGAGPAGYSAALYAARAGLKTALWMGPEPGGQLTTTSMVENYLGFPGGILGPELMERCKKQVAEVGVELFADAIVKIEPNDGSFILHADKHPAKARSVIVATGAVAKWLNTPSEIRLRGKGVSACATCDGFFFRNKRVTVVGAGDVAMEDALTLAQIADSVTVLVRRGEDGVRASKAMFDRARQHEKISFQFYSEIEEFIGENRLTAIRVKNNKDGLVEEMEMDGVFIAIGHRPNTAFCRDLLSCDAEGYLITEGTETSVPGIFAAGDVADRVYRQAITSAGSGCMAMLDAKRWLES